MKEKEKYVAPETKMAQVETENAFAASHTGETVVDKSDVTIGGQGNGGWDGNGEDITTEWGG